VALEVLRDPDPARVVRLERSVRLVSRRSLRTSVSQNGHTPHFGSSGLPHFRQGFRSLRSQFGQRR
jgi:hypothetical protein